MNIYSTIPQNNKITTGSFEEFETGLYKAMHRVKQSFFEVGYWLYHASDKHQFLSNNGYSNIAEYAFEKYGLSKSTTYDLIKVYRRFRDDTGLATDPQYIRLSQSQLVALSRMKYTERDFLSKVKPTDTVSDIEKAVKIYNSRISHGLCTSNRGYSDIKEYLEANEIYKPQQITINSRCLEKEDADELLTAILCTKRTYNALLIKIQDKHVWTSEIRSIFFQIENCFSKLEKAIKCETKEEQ